VNICYLFNFVIYIYVSDKRQRNDSFEASVEPDGLFEQASSELEPAAFDFGVVTIDSNDTELIAATSTMLKIYWRIAALCNESPQSPTRTFRYGLRPRKVHSGINIGRYLSVDADYYAKVFFSL